MRRIVLPVIALTLLIASPVKAEMSMTPTAAAPFGAPVDDEHVFYHLLFDQLEGRLGKRPGRLGLHGRIRRPRRAARHGQQNNTQCKTSMSKMTHGEIPLLKRHIGMSGRLHQAAFTAEAQRQQRPDRRRTPFFEANVRFLFSLRLCGESRS